MNETFTNALEIRLTIHDAGIVIQTGADIAEFPYGSIEDKLKVGILGNLTVSGHGLSRVFVALGQDKARLKEAVAFADKMNKQAAPCSPRTYTDAASASREYRMRCKVCGHIFCYTDDDIKENEENAQIVERERKSAVLNAFAGTTLQSSLDTASADRRAAMLRDFSRCPQCHSADLVELTADADAAAPAAEPATAPFSAADEIRKFKELLDLGVITQEEFDAKKKQLLGL